MEEASTIMQTVETLKDRQSLVPYTISRFYVRYSWVADTMVL